MTNLRYILLEKLSSIGLERTTAWCMIGDLNDIFSNEEKLGGPVRLISSFQPFKNMLLNCDMHELGSTCIGFTWGGTRNGQWIQSKLDRCFGNSEWFNLFPNSHQWFLERLGSDHRLVLVKFVKDQEVFKGQFCFDKRFADFPNCADAIHGSWNGKFNSSSMLQMVHCRKAISRWKKTSEYNAQ